MSAELYETTLLLQDAVSLLLTSRPDQPLEFFANYFAEALQDPEAHASSNVMLRKFAFASRNARAQRGFVQCLHTALGDLDQDEPLSAGETTQLIRLVCPDAPSELASDACQLCGDRKGRHPLGRLLQAIALCLLHAQYFRSVQSVFEACDTDLAGRVERSVLGLALRDVARATETGPLDAARDRAYDELVRGRGEISLREAQAALASRLGTAAHASLGEERHRSWHAARGPGEASAAADGEDS